MFENMSTNGIIFMIIAWGTVFSMLSYCLIKVFTGETDLEKAAEKKKAKKM